MSRLAVNPAAASTGVGPGQPGTRGPSSGDGAGFEVAIRSQLDSGRSTQPRDRVDPADPRGRSVISERSQRPSPETRFEGPDRSHSTSARPPKPSDRVSADAPTRSRERTVETSARADASPATPGEDRASATDPTTVAGGAQARATDGTTPASSTAATAPSTGHEVGAGSSATAGTSAGSAPVSGAAGAATVDPARTPTGGATTTATTATTGTPAQDAAVAGTPDAGQGQPGAGGQGAGQGQHDSPVASLVHGRPAALTGATAPRSEGGADASSPAAGPVALDAATSPSTTAAPGATPAVAPTASVVATASTDATAATLAPAAPTTGTATAATVAGPPAANPVVPPPAQAQVLSALSPLLTGPDGTHRVTVTLEPENLGKVRVQLSLSGGEVALHLIAADAATRETLRQGLPELRAQLEQSGLRTAGMDVQSGSADLFGQAGAGAGAGNADGGPTHRAGHRSIPSLRTTAADAAPATNPTSRTLSHDVALDVRM